MGRPSHDPVEEGDPAKFGWAIDVEEMDPATETAVPLGVLLPLRRQTGSSQPLKALTSPLQGLAQIRGERRSRSARPLPIPAAGQTTMPPDRR